jgi:ribonuclease-3
MPPWFSKSLRNKLFLVRIPFFNPYKSSREKRIAAILKGKFGVRIRKMELYTQALCHKSAAKNVHKNRKLSNERLEFLGDAVIDSIVADHLYRTHPDAEEGDMTKMKSRIVSRINLNKAAVNMDLHLLVETDAQAFHSQKSLGGNALEAIIGAIYLDRGYASAKSAVLFALKNFAELGNVKSQDIDFKSRLYEQAHKKGAEIFFKTEPIESSGGTHLFGSSVIWKGKRLSTGEGTSKKKAEQNAAKEALRNIDH